MKKNVPDFVANKWKMIEKLGFLVFKILYIKEKID